MIQQIHSAAVFSQFDLTMQLGPTKLRLRMTYRERTASWYLDIYELNGTPLLLGRRLTPTWSPLYNNALIPNLIDGYLYVRGSEGYRQKDLGTDSLVLWYIPASDLLLFAPDTSDDLATTTIVSP